MYDTCKLTPTYRPEQKKWQHGINSIEWTNREVYHYIHSLTLLKNSPQSATHHIEGIIKFCVVNFINAKTIGFSHGK